MTELNQVVGVDACPYGWCATTITGNSISSKLYESFEALHTENEGHRIFVDIPIGLPTDSRRRCDIEARDLLGCRGNSVFYPPCESAVTKGEYDKANREHKSKMNYGLSRQAFNIRPKINQVTDIVPESNYDDFVRESHPELCFMAFNGQPIAYPKSSERGREMRLDLLESEINGASDAYCEIRERRLLKEVRRDDIMDSMALAVAAQYPSLSTVPEAPAETEPRIYFPAIDELPRL